VFLEGNPFPILNMQNLDHFDELFGDQLLDPEMVLMNAGLRDNNHLLDGNDIDMDTIVVIEFPSPSILSSSGKIVHYPRIALATIDKQLLPVEQDADNNNNPTNNNDSTPIVTTTSSTHDIYIYSNISQPHGQASYDISPHPLSSSSMLSSSSALLHPPSLSSSSSTPTSSPSNSPSPSPSIQQRESTNPPNSDPSGSGFVAVDI